MQRRQVSKVKRAMRVVAVTRLSNLNLNLDLG
jgi:hypothetical protein